MGLYFYTHTLIAIYDKSEELIIKKSYIIIFGSDCHLKFGGMKQEFRVIVDHNRNGEILIWDELTVCHWEEVWIDENGTVLIFYK